VPADVVALGKAITCVVARDNHDRIRTIVANRALHRRPSFLGRPVIEYVLRGEHEIMDSDHVGNAYNHFHMPNRLIHERSPYLLQHAHNPVDWYPWGEEAFERARTEGRPIFLSIGYSTCHWCHVMERESFEDEETAALMNSLYVNIKVDREERPDVDHVYMTASQALTGGGGWPLSVWLTPDLKPFYVGTYFPPRPAHGRPSFGNALRSLNNAWVDKRDKVLESADGLTEAIKAGAAAEPEPQGSGVDAEELSRLCFAGFDRSYDASRGGFGGAPKFPRPSIFEFLLRYHYHTEAHRPLDMAVGTMRRIAAGGIFDHLGGGFARYSVDADWRVPHFEKMLYDQGQLLATFADAYRIQPDDWLVHAIDKTVDYLQRDLVDSSGLFYSAEDADSEGEEGTFYVWTVPQLRSVLDDVEFQAIRHRYGVTEQGNFEHGRNVLHSTMEIGDVARGMEMSVDGLQLVIHRAMEKLFEARCRRVRPSRDDKVLASWNGLAISGLSRSASACQQQRYRDLAVRAANGLVERMFDDGLLYHRLSGSDLAIPGFLDDYAFVAQGFLDLYDATLDPVWLRHAESLVRRGVTLFEDEEHGGYFMSRGDDPHLLVRAKVDHDGAEPSGNSVMASVLLRLGRLIRDEEMIRRAGETIDLFGQRIRGYPMMMPLLVGVALEASWPPRQIVIAESDDDAENEAAIADVLRRYHPGTSLYLRRRQGVDPWLLARVPELMDMGPVDGRTAIYICENFVCERPVSRIP